MPKPWIAAVITALVLAAPAGAQEVPEEPEPTPPCEESEEYATLGLDGATEDVEPALIPAVGHDILEEPYREEAVTRYRYRLDVSGSEELPTAIRADVRFAVTWDNDGDFDLYVYDADGELLGSSTQFNPQAGAGETVQLSQIDHCADLTVEIVNYLASPLTTMEMRTTVSRLR